MPVPTANSSKVIRFGAGIWPGLLSAAQAAGANDKLTPAAGKPAAMDAAGADRAGNGSQGRGRQGHQ